MRGTFCCVAMKVAIAFYKTYVILFYYEVLKHYGISHKRVLGNPSPRGYFVSMTKYLGG